MAARAGQIGSLRHPRTRQELRAGAVRAKRRNIPTAWDDLGRDMQRSWKAQRRLKWRRIALLAEMPTMH